MISTDRHLLDRFRRHHEESAFEALLERHGPMVHGLCRRVLGDRHAAGDAFQATFLVLARRAASIRRADSLASWLYGVAYRVAGKLRARAAGSRETPVGEVPEVPQPGADPVGVTIWRELRGILDDELTQLPDKYRAPLVLCYLEGKSKAEAARELGWPATSVASRLERGRELLRTRLARRGVALSAALIFPVLTEYARAVPPAGVAKLTGHAAWLLAVGEETSANGISASASTLAEGMARTMALTKLKIAAVALLVVGMLGSGVGLLVRPAAMAQAPVKAPAPEVKTAPKAEPVQRPARDRFTDPLPPDAQARLGTTRFRHVGVNFLALIRDGQEIVTGDSTGAFRVWDAKTGRELRRFGKVRADTLLGLKTDNAAANMMLKMAAVLSSSYFAESTLLADGRTLAQTAVGGTVRFWDVMTGKELGRFKPAQEINGAAVVAIAPDGKSVFMLDTDFIIRQLDRADGKEIRRFGKKREGETFGGNPVVLSPNGKTLAAALPKPGDKNKPTTPELCLFDVATGKEIAVIEAPGPSRDSPQFTPDSKQVVWPSLFGANMQRYDAATGKNLKSIGPFRQRLRPMFAVSPDSKLLAVRGTHDQSVALWNMETGKPVRTLAASNRSSATVFLRSIGFSSRSLAFSPDGKTLAAGGQGNTVRRWDVETGKELSVVGGHVGSVTALAASPDGKEVVSVGADRTLRRWSAPDGKESARTTLPDWAYHTAFSPAARLALLTDGVSRAEIWDVVAAKPLRSLALPDGQSVYVESANDLAFSRDGKIAAARTADQTVHLWDTATGKRLLCIPYDGKGGRFLHLGFGEHGPSASRLALSPDGEFLAVIIPVGGREEVRDNGFTSYSAPDSAVQLWHVPTGKPVRTFAKHSGVLLGLAFSPDGRTIAGVDETSVVVWETVTGKKRFRFGSGGHAVAFSPVGRTLAVGGDDGTVHCLDLWTNREVGRFKGHQGLVTALAFAPNGKALISGGADTTALVWDAARLARPKRDPAAALDEPEQELCWSKLSGTDAELAWDKVRLLAGTPATAVALARRLRPLEPAAPEQMKQLLADLQSNQFSVREKSAAELEKLGERAAPALRELLATRPPLEVRQRLEKLLERLVLAPLSPDQLRATRVIELLERLGTPEAHKLLQDLAAGAPSARQTREAKAALRAMDAAKSVWEGKDS